MTPLDVNSSGLSPTVVRGVVEEQLDRSVQDVREVEEMDFQETDGELTEEGGGLPNYDEVMESRWSRDGNESGSVIGLPLYRERDDGGDDAGDGAEVDGHDRDSIGVIIADGSSGEGSFTTTVRYWAFVDERPGWGR